MFISWLGHSAFKIETKPDSESLTVIIDPFEDSIGIKMPKLKADVALVSHDHFDHNNIKALKGEPFVIQGPGEYEVKGVVVYGVPTFHDDQQGAERGPNTCFRIDSEDLSIAHLGDLGHPLKGEQLEFLEGADVLMIPVGGTYTIGPKQAAEIVASIEPRIVIPMHYQVSGLKIDLKPVNDFLKEMGVKNPQTDSRLKVVKKDLMAEDTTVVVLDRAG